MATRADRKELRNFGLIVGAIFGLIGLWPLVWRGEGVRLWAMVLATLLIMPALVMPKVLAPAHRLWMALGHVLGWFNTRLILGLVFFGLMTPIALLFRLLGKDPMRRTFEGEASTYRVPRQTRPGAHMMRQF